MMREQRRALVELVGVEVRNRARDSFVGSRTPIRQLRMVGHLLRQRMLERVLGDRIQALRVNQLSRDELPQLGLELLYG